MKLTGVLLLIVCLQVSARTNAQVLSLSVKNVSLKEVFTEIEKKTGYTFFYDVTILKNAKPVTVEMKDASVDVVLKEVLKDQGLEFSITSQTIFVKKELAKKVVENGNGDGPPTGTLKATGVVLNEAGQPLSGASVTIMENKKSTITNVKGEFAVSQVPANATLIISYIGYEPQKIKIIPGKKINVKLKVTTNELDKVVIQAYGETSQRLATGDIGVVTAEDIEKQPVMNPLMALQGRVAGLDITQTSGYASAPILATIRGQNSINPNEVTDPLYIVDGVPLTVVEIGGQSYSTTGSTGFLQNGTLIGPANGQSPLFNINPSDIESISVLKDADATSIYGSRGANGVILITTKKGKPGKTQFNVHIDEGINRVTRFWSLLNTPQYLAMRREAFNNDAISSNSSNAPDLYTWDTSHYTDWQRALYGKSGKVINSQLSLSGGDAFTTFRISGSYTHSQEITTASGADQRGSLSFSMTHNSTNRQFVVSLSTLYSITQSNMISIGGSINYAPDAPSIYDSTGKTLNWADWRSSTGNPFGQLLQPYTAKTNFLSSNLILSYEPVKGLSFKSSFGYNNAQANQISLIPIASQDPLSQPTGKSEFGYNNNKNWIIEPQISYETQIGIGKLTALIGGSAQENNTDGIYIYGRGYTSDALLMTVSNAPTTGSTDSYGEYRYASVFGRINYNIDNKYIINGNIRRDGSSNYGPGKQYGNFASIGGAWLFTEENWFKKGLSFLSFGKFRGSYGLTGSDGGIPYGYLTRWISTAPTYDVTVPLVPIQHANPDYHWQENKKLEGAIDLGFFKDFITLSVAYYRNRTGNQLLEYPTPLLSGFSTVLDNLNATVQNAGWEFTVGGKGVHVHEGFFTFDWAPHITFSINENKFLSFPGLGSSPFRNQGLIGKSLNSVYILHFTGVDPQTGVYTYEDKNHDGKINPNYGTTGDGYFKKLSPSFNTGFGFNFGIKDVKFSLFFYAKKQIGINAISQGNYPGTFNNNQPVEVLSRWQRPGDITNVGKFSTINAQDPHGYLSNSDLGYTDASYIRLQNLSVSYSLPDNIMKKMGFKWNVFILANNLLTITDYKGIDPEAQRYGSLPPAKTLAAGLSFDF